MNTSNESLAMQADFKRRLEAANTVEKLEELKATLICRVQEIQSQLSDKNRQSKEGRINNHDYHSWRSKALHAKTCIERDLREVKLRIKSFNMRTFHNGVLLGDGLKLETPEQMLSAASNLLRRFNYEFELSTEEKSEVFKVQDAIDAFLKTKVTVKPHAV